MKKIWIMCAVVLITVLFYGCDDSSNRRLAVKQEALMSEAERQVGMPAITRFTERRTMKMIMELRDREGLVNYAYLFSEMSGKLTFIGKCIGYPLPYSTQYTNPQAVASFNHSIVLPQADPNALFMPASAEATFVMLIDPSTGKPHPVYFEPRVTVSPFPLQ